MPNPARLIESYKFYHLFSNKCQNIIFSKNTKIIIKVKLLRVQKI